MAVVKRGLVLVLVLLLFIGFCNGSVYKVGDSAGWTIIGDVDYAKWASSKTFQVGDTLAFEYDRAYHNVLQVSRSDYHSCNVAAPIATYATSNDSIVIRQPGHYYYICGFVGHCPAGQKVDIRVPKSYRPTLASSPSPSPSLIPIPIQAPRGSIAPKPSPFGPLAPSPAPSSGESLKFCNVGILGFLVWAFYL